MLYTRICKILGRYIRVKVGLGFFDLEDLNYNTEINFQKKILDLQNRDNIKNVQIFEQNWMDFEKRDLGF